MCLCQPPPVFMKPPGWTSFFLDDLLGQGLADRVRGMVGQPLLHDGPFGRLCPCGDGYIAASFSSVWSLLVLLVALGAGLVFPFSKRVAGWMLGIGAAVSLLDTGVRVAIDLQRFAPSPSAGEARSVMLHNLPGQLLANALFQFAIPFAAGVVPVLLALWFGRVAGRWLPDESPR